MARHGSICPRTSSSLRRERLAAPRRSAPAEPSPCSPGAAAVMPPLLLPFSLPALVGTEPQPPAPARTQTWLPRVALCALLVAFEEVGVLLGAVGALENHPLKDTAQHRVSGNVLLHTKQSRLWLRGHSQTPQDSIPGCPDAPLWHGPDGLGVFCIFPLLPVVPRAALRFNSTSKMGMK